MKPTPGPALTDDELHALVDSQGLPDSLDTLRRRLADDPQASDRLAHWQRQRDALRELHAQALQEAVPPALLQAAGLAKGSHLIGHSWQRYGGMAAAVAMAFAAGWFANARWQGDMPNSAATVAQVHLERDFVRQASLAHRVYVPEIRHPVEPRFLYRDFPKSQQVFLHFLDKRYSLHLCKRRLRQNEETDCTSTGGLVALKFRCGPRYEPLSRTPISLRGHT